MAFTANRKFLQFPFLFCHMRFKTVIIIWYVHLLSLRSQLQIHTPVHSVRIILQVLMRSSMTFLYSFPSPSPTVLMLNGSLISHPSYFSRNCSNVDFLHFSLPIFMKRRIPAFCILYTWSTLVFRICATSGTV